MRDILLFAALGLGAGALIASIALGVVLTYRGSGVINVATGADRDGRAPTSSGRSGPASSASSSPTAPAFVLTLRLHGRVRRADRARRLPPAAEHGAARQAGGVARAPARRCRPA